MTEYIPNEVRQRVREDADQRCGYCLSPQHLVLGALEIEHIIPTSRDGSNDIANLWLACRLCNNSKSNQIDHLDLESNRVVELFNPRRQVWSANFFWSEDGTRIIGATACGRATVVALRLNNIIAVSVRRHWVAAGWHPPDESATKPNPNDQ